jgi:hypothetical protein
MGTSAARPAPPRRRDLGSGGNLGPHLPNRAASWLRVGARAWGSWVRVGAGSRRVRPRPQKTAQTLRSPRPRRRDLGTGRHTGARPQGGPFGFGLAPRPASIGFGLAPGPGCRGVDPLDLTTRTTRFRFGPSYGSLFIKAKPGDLLERGGSPPPFRAFREEKLWRAAALQNGAGRTPPITQSRSGPYHRPPEQVEANGRRRVATPVSKTLRSDCQRRNLLSDRPRRRGKEIRW